MVGAGGSQVQVLPPLWFQEEVISGFAVGRRPEGGPFGLAAREPIAPSLSEAVAFG